MTHINEKGWGREVVFADTDLYCGKLLHFYKKGNKFSMHFHAIKDETWYVQQGSFLIRWIDTNNAQIIDQLLLTGQTWRNKQFEPHQLEALADDSIIIEVSTKDIGEDNYRVMPGDSQNENLC